MSTNTTNLNIKINDSYSKEVKPQIKYKLKKNIISFNNLLELIENQSSSKNVTN